MAFKNKCKFSGECSIYNGEEKIEMDLTIYKNVFCHRGHNGWNNCKKYVELIKTEENK